MMRLIKTTGWLAMAAAIIFGTAACSSSDDSIAEQQPVNPTEQKVYTMTIQATKATGGATTRGLSLDGKTLNVKWNEGEQVEVVQTSGTTSKSLGTLKAKASTDGITTLTGELVGLQTGAQLKFYLHGASYDYTGQKGVLLKADGNNSIEEKYDYAFAATYDYTIDGTNVTVPSGINLEGQQSIVKFILVDDSGNPVNVTSLKIDTKNYIIETIDNVEGNTQGSKSMTITPTSGTNVIYAAIRNTEPNKDKPNDYTLTATDADGIKYAYTKNNVTFVNGKYYEVKVKMPKRCTLSQSTVGMIVGTDGLAYYVEDKDNLPTDVTPAGMVAYKNGSNGLVIALTNMDSEKMWRNSINEANTYKPEVKGQTWKVPSVDEWKLMLGANNDDGNDRNCKGLNTAIEKAGGTALQMLTGYWTSTHKSPYIYYMSISSPSATADFNPMYDDEGASMPVRVCFDF